MTNALNLCDIPPWVLASREFNDNPVPIVIQGAVAADRNFFRTLDETDGEERRAELFADYIAVKFYLHEADGHSGGARRAIKNSYVRYVRGWGMDSNTPEGATLKGWVESRFGLRPTYHRQPLPKARERGSEEDYSPYDIDRTIGMARTNAIYGQLDLLYAFCQYELRRRASDQKWLTLYRGTYDAKEHELIERIDRRSYYVKLNNLVSFTSEVERAWEFGTTVWRVRVPIVKILFFSELLPSIGLRGENEHLVIGGEYRVVEEWG